jgi:3-polyprenyl-4-hydroxybenzoate decarboxylase
MKYQNLRDWLSIIEHRGELTLVENVDWKLEMGAIVDVLYREHPPYAPALIFDRIKDHKPGYRALFGHFASPQLALTLGLKKNLTTFYNSRACTTRE